MSYIWHENSHTYARYDDTIHDLGLRHQLWINYYCGIVGFDGDLYVIPGQTKILLFEENQIIGLAVISSTPTITVTESLLISRRHQNYVNWYSDDREFRLDVESSRKYREVLLAVGYTYKVIATGTLQWNYNKTELPAKITICKPTKPTKQVAYKSAAKPKLETSVADFDCV